MTRPTDFDYLISRYLDGRLTRSEGAMLSDWVKQEEANADSVALAALLHSRMYDVLHSERILEDENLSHDPLDDAAVMPAIRLPNDPEPIEVTQSQTAPEIAVPAAPRATIWGTFWKYRRTAAVLIAVGALGIIVALYSRSPRPQLPNAMMTSSVNATWDQKFEPGETIPGNVLTLKSGFAEIQFQRGAAITLEGPARLQVLSDNSVSLLEGKLSAKVPESAHGFVVQTQTARVTDLGTEFGVSVDESGETKVEVFKGNVEAQRLDAAPGMPPTHLIAGFSATVTAQKLTVAPAALGANTFVQSLAAQEQPLDVLDLIAGGDGTTHRRAFNIDQRTGQADADPAAMALAATSADPSTYHRISASPVLDGTFVPALDTPVDSAGDRFMFQNARGTAVFHIFVGGAVQWPSAINGVPYPVRLGGTDYSAANHGFIFMHANAGVTLNLAEIRRLHPANTLRTFEAVVGNYRNQISPDHPETIDSRADAFVLVDGVARFSRLDFTRGDGAIPIKVPIRDSDRFITLAITAGTDGTNSDWIAFGDPTLQ